MRNFEKIITKKKRRGYDEHVELVKATQEAQRRQEAREKI
ncbi:hypothetical protein JLBYU16_40 [Escherichia phage JLBYU16]|uniref:Uncharacterized protein n=1 Tax=Escherichia phage JLBYU16 TaxID=2894738 RepID=A0AAE9CFB1_9CAUD|nr:hypothetical protein JLBYU16_40 [Escherichia phage JLBYU16]UGO56185.1 hypothetical protein JLBYU38_38 [Escherichia phage JLBYU38]